MIQNIIKAGELVSAVASVGETPAAQPRPEDFLAAVQAQLNAFTKHLKEDEDVALFSTVGQDRMRVYDVEFTPPDVVILHGLDTENNRTTALVHLDAVQFVCRVFRTKASGRSRPVGFHLPKAK